MRCVVCGALPAEECNQRTHDAHYRMWVHLSPAKGAGSTLAESIVAAIDAARAKDAA